MCVPSTGIVYDPKVEYYLDMLSMPSAGPVYDFDPDYAFTSINELVKNRGSYSESLHRQLVSLQEAAHNDEKLLIKLLTRKK